MSAKRVNTLKNLTLTRSGGNTSHSHIRCWKESGVVRFHKIWMLDSCKQEWIRQEYSLSTAFIWLSTYMILKALNVKFCHLRKLSQLHVLTYICLLMVFHFSSGVVVEYIYRRTKLLLFSCFPLGWSSLGGAVRSSAEERNACKHDRHCSRQRLIFFQFIRKTYRRIILELEMMCWEYKTVCDKAMLGMMISKYRVYIFN